MSNVSWLLKEIGGFIRDDLWFIIPVLLFMALYTVGDIRHRREMKKLFAEAKYERIEK